MTIFTSYFRRRHHLRQRKLAFLKISFVVKELFAHLSVTSPTSLGVPGKPGPPTELNINPFNVRSCDEKSPLEGNIGQLPLQGCQGGSPRGSPSYCCWRHHLRQRKLAFLKISFVVKELFAHLSVTNQTSLGVPGKPGPPTQLNANPFGVRSWDEKSPLEGNIGQLPLQGCKGGSPRGSLSYCCWRHHLRQRKLAFLRISFVVRDLFAHLSVTIIIAQVLVSDCRFGVSPVNYPDPDQSDFPGGTWETWPADTAQHKSVWCTFMRWKAPIRR